MATRVEAEAGQSTGRAPANAGAPQPALSLVVPTRNEVDNIDELVARIESVMPETAMEIVFVDDS
ncbi:MAG: hypothetical protein QOF37_512, partial [Thermoleophilaceae bacterium]|nr:hypothetical protein [Thermoleophilaceae bacterium]